MIDAIVALLIMVWLVNAILFPSFMLYDLAMNTFILRGEPKGTILEFQSIKWSWVLNYTDDINDYDTGALVWIILDVFGGLVFLAMAIMLLVSGLLWWILGITAALYIARELADSLRGHHD